MTTTAQGREAEFGIGADPRQKERTQMKSNIRDVGDTRIIELGGKITIGTGDVKIRELISQALDDDKKDILFDLGDVTAIDSSGIGEMVACYTTVTKRGGQLKLMHLSPKINDILQVTQLITVFEVFDDEREALGSF
jgi:anti-sigma B factor antagonist